MCPRCKGLKPSFFDFLTKDYLLKRRKIACKYCKELYQIMSIKRISIFERVQDVLLLVITYISSNLLRIFTFEIFEVSSTIMKFLLLLTTGFIISLLLLFFLRPIGLYILWKSSGFEIQEEVDK